MYRLTAGATGGGGFPACVALLTSVPPLGIGGGGSGITIGTAPGMFGTGAGRTGERPPSGECIPGGVGTPGGGTCIPGGVGTPGGGMYIPGGVGTPGGGTCIPGGVGTPGGGMYIPGGVGTPGGGTCIPGGVGTPGGGMY